MSVTEFAAYPSGFQFHLKAQFHALEPDWQARHAETDRALHFGLQFPDGSRVATYSTRPTPASAGAPAGIVLRLLSFGGGIDHQYWRYWVWPLPPAGSLTFVCEWPAFGVGESAVQTDTGSIRLAAQNASLIKRGQGRK